MKTTHYNNYKFILKIDNVPGTCTNIDLLFPVTIT